MVAMKEHGSSSFEHIASPPGRPIEGSLHEYLFGTDPTILKSLREQLRQSFKDIEENERAAAIAAQGVFIGSIANEQRVGEV